jgi:arylsulfatase A-like enzyme
MSNRTTARVVLLAIWLALITGLVEGIGLLVAQKLRWLDWETLQRGVALEIVWIAPLVNLVVFGFVGAMLILVGRVLPRLEIIRIAAFAFAFMAFADLVALTGRMLLYSVVIFAAGLATVAVRWFFAREDAAWGFLRSRLAGIVAVTLLALVGIEGGGWLFERIAIGRLPSAAPGKPNVLVIVIDTLRADHLSSYGYGRPTTPNIDRIARQGVLFERAFSASSWTAPSHATMLTGRLPVEHQVEWNRNLDDQYPVIPEVLRKEGYRTAAFTGNSDWFSRRVGFGRGFIHFEDYFYSAPDMVVRTVYGRALSKLWIFRRLGLSTGLFVEKERRRAPRINRSALQWIQRDPETPFFVFLNYYDVHAPYARRDPHRENSSGSTERSGPRGIDDYDGEIAYVDEHVGQLLKELEAFHLAQPLLVIVTSDHGESFGDHGFYLHANSLFLNEVQVPLILRWPEAIPAGVRIETPVTNAALPATVVDLVGGAERSVFPRSSLAGIWQRDRAIQDHGDILAEIAQQPFAPEKAPTSHGWMKSILTTEWHFLEHEKFGSQLYAWRSDPGELNNLAERPDLQDVVNRFRSRLEHDARAEASDAISRR